MYIVGIDIGKRNHEASIMNAAGKQYGKPIRFANSHTGFNKLMDWVKNISGADDVVFGMEATGHYWLALYTHLCHEGYAVHVINAVQSDALRGMYIRQVRMTAETHLSLPRSSASDAFVKLLFQHRNSMHCGNYAAIASGSLILFRI